MCVCARGEVTGFGPGGKKPSGVERSSSQPPDGAGKGGAAWVSEGEQARQGQARRTQILERSPRERWVPVESMWASGRAGERARAHAHISTPPPPHALAREEKPIAELAALRALWDTMPESIPSSFKALQLEKPPPPPPAADADNKKQTPARNVAVLRERPMPPQQDGMILVKMHAAGFNRRDEWSMIGAYPGLTFDNSTFGCDGVGTVVRGTRAKSASSDNVPPHPKGLVVLVPTRGWFDEESAPEAAIPSTAAAKTPNKLGGKGFGLLGGTAPTGGIGTFAEYAQVEDDMVTNVPAHLSAIEASALPCGGVTAFRALFTKGRLQRGQTVLITGIGGGVALLALQFAVAAGLAVFVTGGSAEKIKRAEKLGARGGVLYRDADWPKQLAKLVIGRSKDRPYLDVVIDSAGGEVPAQAAKAGLRAGGRIVCYGMTATPKMTFTMREVLRNVDVVGEYGVRTIFRGHHTT